MRGTASPHGLEPTAAALPGAARPKRDDVPHNGQPAVHVPDAGRCHLGGALQGHPATDLGRLEGGPGRYDEGFARTQAGKTGQAIGAESH